MKYNFNDIYKSKKIYISDKVSSRVMFIDWKMHFYSIPRPMLHRHWRSERILHWKPQWDKNEIESSGLRLTYAFGNLIFFFLYSTLGSNKIVLLFFFKCVFHSKKSTRLYVLIYFFFLSYLRTVLYNTNKHSLLATRHSFILYNKLLEFFPFEPAAKRVHKVIFWNLMNIL